MLNEVIRRLNELELRVQALEVADGAPDALVMVDGVTAPSAVVDLALIYVDITDGDLKIKFGNGFIATIAADS